MKINPNVAAPQAATLTSRRQTTTQNKSAVTPVSHDDQQDEMDAARSQLAVTPDGAPDANQLSALQASVQSGEFTLDSDAIAESMLSFFGG